MNRIILTLLISLMSISLVKSAEKTETRAEQLMSETRPLVIAHRGYSMVAPENTLASFEFALSAGADLVELDYHHSKDGVPVVLHDYTLDRTTDATNRLGGSKIRADARNADEITKLNAGSWFNPRFALEKPPLLSDALDFIQKKGVTLIERKAGDAATCVELLKKKNLINDVIVQAFDWNYLTEFHKLAPQQVLGALGPPSTKEGRKLTDDEKRLNSAWVDGAKATGSRVVVWSRAVSKEAIDYAHGKGLKVWVYTINEPELANKLLDAGVDGIITDNPALIWRTIAIRKQQ